MQKNIDFKNSSLEQLAKEEANAYAPLYDKLNETLAKICAEKGYAFIIDTDTKAVPVVNPLMCEDINQTVQDALK